LLGPKLRQLLRDRYRTQLEMAAKLGISVAYVNL